MIQNYGSSPGQISSNPSLWSLPVEMELYLVFPLFYWLASRLGMRSILTIVALVSLLGLGLYLTGAEWMMANFIKYWIIWCSGTLLAEWVASGRVPNWSLRSTVTTLLFLFVAAGALLAGVSTAVQHFLWACFYFMAFWFLLSLPIPSANYTSLPFRLLSGLGTISYSLYLVHYPFFRLSGTLWLSHFEDKPANFLIPLAFSVAAVGVAVLFYGIVERPSYSISRALSLIMVVLSHPTGSMFVRALIEVLFREDLLGMFFTTVAFEMESHILEFLPRAWQRVLNRRQYPLPGSKIRRQLTREGVRLFEERFNLSLLSRHETGWASVDSVYRALDRKVARQRKLEECQAVYCYEDGAYHTFTRAAELGLPRLYELPIAYWKTARKIQQEEAERYPEWKSTLGATIDSDEKKDRKDAEIELADWIICPSRFVLDSLPGGIRKTKNCLVSEFGTPASVEEAFRQEEPREAPLRLFFAGSMTQRKGLADLFTAMKLLNRSDVRLVVMGSLKASMEFYFSQYPDFQYEEPRPHAEVLELMRRCDVLVLPSLVEGRAQVQQEAMACCLPLIVTPNAGGEDLIGEGETGFLVPIRSPESLAEKIAWCADNRIAVRQMGEAARKKAMTYTWERYSGKIIEAIRQAVGGIQKSSG